MPSPLAPGEALVPVVRVTFLLEGDVASFDEVDFRARVTRTLGATSVFLSVQPGSVRVTCMATFDSTVDASVASVVLETYSTDYFSKELGVTIEEVAAIKTDIGVAAQPRPPPTPPPVQPPSVPPQPQPPAPKSSVADASTSAFASLAGVGGVVAVLTLLNSVVGSGSVAAKDVVVVEEGTSVTEVIINEGEITSTASSLPQKGS